MNFKWILWVSALFCLCGCGGTEVGLYLPEGDSQAGREAFAKMLCHSCHKVSGEDFPAPVADPPVPVVLGSQFASQTRQEIAESIIAPSHRFAGQGDSAASSVAPSEASDPAEPATSEITIGSHSRMGDYSQAITVRELIDIVEFLKSLKGQT